MSESGFRQDTTSAMVVPSPKKDTGGYLVKSTFQFFDTPYRKYTSANKAHDIDPELPNFVKNRN